MMPHLLECTRQYELPFSVCSMEIVLDFGRDRSDGDTSAYPFLEIGSMI